MPGRVRCSGCRAGLAERRGNAVDGGPMPASSPLFRQDGPFFVLAASPRPGGNSDTAARLFLQGFSRTVREDGGNRTGAGPAKNRAVPEPTCLRSYRVDPCVACNACIRAAKRLKNPDQEDAGAPGQGPSPHFGCPLTLKDDSAPLLRSLAEARGLCLVSPIYFYHLPAALKALVDRTQPFWALRDAGIACHAGQRPRICHVILLAARPKGDKLFEGSLLTLKYALAPLNIRLAEPLLLRGLDGPSALLGRPGAMQAVAAYGEEAGKLL